MAACLAGRAPFAHAAQPRIQLSRPPAAKKASGQAGDALTLDAAIRRALAANRTVQLQKLSLRSSELTYQNAWDAMFMPSASLNANSGASASFAQLDTHGNTVSADHGYPASTLDLNLGTFTLFNGWKDWIQYQQASLDWTRASEVYAESVRQVRFSVITAYFRLRAEQEKLDAGARAVQIADAILELVKSRVRRRQATEVDVSSSSVDLLNAKNDYAFSEASERSALWNLNQLLGDPVGTAYQIKDTIRFAPVTLTAAQALKIYWERAPTVRNGKHDVKRAEMDVELAEKNQLPLPKVVFNGVTLSYGNTYYGGVYAPFSDAPGSPNVGVSVSVGVSLPIYGQGGFLGSRTVAQSEIARERADLLYQDAANRDVASVYGAFAAIKRDEETIANDRQVFENSATLLDDRFGKLASGAISRLELRDALTQARNSEVNLLESNVTHLIDKLTLAQLIGVDRLPGDIY
jgi:outer membrane protein TolC